MGRVVGIDLGTTYSAVAVLGDDGLPEILKNADGEPTTPSVVLFQSFDGKDEPLVGTMAKHSAASDPDNVVQFVKRQMGNPDWRFDSDSGVSYSAEEVSSLIIKKLLQDAEQALGEEVCGAVITVPAYFDDARRTATKQAGVIAGTKVLRVLNEPTAAALSFGLDTEKNGVTLVYDLGGGTFDVTLLKIEDGCFTVIGTDGDRNLGGFDFDNALMSFAAKELSKQGAGNVLEDYLISAELREKCEMVKRTLSNVAKANLHISKDGKPHRVTITREDFERVSKSLLTRTKELVEDVLEDTGYSWSQIDHVVLVGGSTRMPMVHKLIEEISGMKPELGVNPDEAVAMGAAVQAAIEMESSLDEAGLPKDGLPDMPIFEVPSVVITDVTSQPLGVVMLDKDGKDYNEVVIPRNSPVPGSYSQDAATVCENQSCVNVQVTQGDDPDLNYVVIIGSKEIPLPAGLPKSSPIRIVYEYDKEQTVHIRLYDGENGRLYGEFEIDRVANMDERQLDAAVNKMKNIEIG